MDCSCVYIECDDFVTLLSDQIIKKSRKNHKCDECKQIIHQGESYRKEVFIFDGFTIHRTCDTCLSIRETLFCDGIIYGEMWYLLREEIANTDGDINQTCIASLIPSARNKVCDMIQNYWDNYLFELE